MCNTYRYKSKKDSYRDEKALEAQLEREYILERFYDCRTITLGVSLLMILKHALIFCYPGGRYFGMIGVVHWSIHFVIRNYIHQYKGTKHQERAMNLYRDAHAVMGLFVETLARRDDSLSSEEGRNAHVCMITLVMYFVATTLGRINAPRCHKYYPLIPIVIFPLLALRNPRFGIFEPRQEAIAFFVIFGLAEIIGGAFDELRWKHFVAIQKHKREMSKSLRRISAVEALACSRREETFFEVIR